MEREYRFTDEDGKEHVHELYTGPYDPKRPVKCEGCLLILEEQKIALMEKYGWKSWPWDDN